MKRIFLSAVLVCSIPHVAFAEFNCRANVTYKWQREKAEPQVTYYSSIQAVGVDEAAAKTALNEVAESEKAKASAVCSKLHENQAGCISTKLNSNAAMLQSLNFSSRKLLEESIAVDCKGQQGICLESALSDPRCAEKVAAGAEAGAGKEGGKDAAGNDDKGKKKK